jgi:hypothetical protein
MATEAAVVEPLRIGTAKIDLRNVQLGGDVVLDEVLLEGGDIEIDASRGEQDATITSGETRVRAVMSEANLNRLVTAKMPQDSTVRNLNIALLSGKARISGKALVTFVPLPFTIEAVARVDNGQRVSLDCRSATMGIDLPRAVVDVIEQRINESLGLDVSQLAIPVWIDEIQCEPGRLTALGRARIAWPPKAAIGGSRESEPWSASTAIVETRESSAGPAKPPASSIAETRGPSARTAEPPAAAETANDRAAVGS